MGMQWEQEKKQKCVWDKAHLLFLPPGAGGGGGRAGVSVCMFVGGQNIYSERKRKNTKKTLAF